MCPGIKGRPHYYTDHAKACHETRTVVEKLVVDIYPKLRFEGSDLSFLRLDIGV